MNDSGARSSSVMLNAFSGQKRRNMQSREVLRQINREAGKKCNHIYRAVDARTIVQFPGLKDSSDASRVNANLKKSHLHL